MQEGSAGSSSVSVRAKEAGPAACECADGRHAGRRMGAQAGAESAQAQDGSGRQGVCADAPCRAVLCCGALLTKSASMDVMRLAGLSSSSLRSKSTASFGSCSNTPHHITTRHNSACVDHQASYLTRQVCPTAPSAQSGSVSSLWETPTRAHTCHAQCGHFVG